MKTLLFYLLMTMLYYSSNNNAGRDFLRESAATDSSHTIIFETEVKPIFETHCMPCHFPGGKMYDQLPFDDAGNIINHEEGIFKRIKNAKDVAVIKEFIRQQKNK